jgi:hypothetical protein
VGINRTPNNTYKLDVAGSARFTTGANNNDEFSEVYIGGHVQNSRQAKFRKGTGGTENRALQYYAATAGSSEAHEFYSNLTDLAMKIDASGKVSIGITPVTFDLSAQEQLAEWKTKAKKASWPIVTDGAFEQEPSIEMVQEFVERVAHSGKLQVEGGASINGDLLASKPSAGGDALAVGRLAGNIDQGGNAIALGLRAAVNHQGSNAVAVGTQAGQGDANDPAKGQGQYAVAVGFQAGQTGQGDNSVAIGSGAGAAGQGENTVALGRNAGLTDQGESSVALGRSAGYENQGANSIAIGRSAGDTNQAANGIIISSRGVAESSTDPNHIFLTSGSGKYLYYNGTDAWSIAGGNVGIGGEPGAIGGGNAKLQVAGDVYASGIIYGKVDDVADHIKAITPTQIANWDAGTGGGGGGATTDGRISDTDITNWNQAHGWGNHATAGYQPAGSYAVSNHNHSGVYQPAGDYAPVGASYTKSQSDGRYELKGEGGASGDYVPLQGNSTVNGTITATDFVATSDERLKKNVQTADPSLVSQLRGVTFDWVDSGDASSGVIAQEVERVLPHLVHEDGDSKAVNYNGLVAYLIEEVKALRSELKEISR